MAIMELYSAAAASPSSPPRARTLSKMACSRWGLNTGMPCLPLELGHLGGAAHAPQEQRQQLPVDGVYLFPSFESRASYSFASTGNRSFLRTFCFVPHTLQQPAFRQQLQRGHTGGGLYGGGGPGHNAGVVAAVDGQRGVLTCLQVDGVLLLGDGGRGLKGRPETPRACRW